MSLHYSFFSDKEEDLAAEFLENGYVIRPVDDREALDALRQGMVEIVCDKMGINVPVDVGDFLNNFADHVSIDNLNDVRLHTYRTMNAQEWFRPTYHAIGRSKLATLVGNELAMQNRVNLSIQLPNDDSSLLPIHADAFGGETPYQVVQWLPLVDCFKTKTMFILPRPASEQVYTDFRKYEGKGMDSVFDDVKNDLVWLDVPYGHVLIFSPNNLHGGVVNLEAETRWSMNCRFTGLFTPYRGAEKKLGSYYLPISPRAVTKTGMQYREPSGFEE